MSRAVKKAAIELTVTRIVTRHDGVLQSKVVPIVALQVGASESYVSAIICGMDGIERSGGARHTRLHIKREAVKVGLLSRIARFFGWA